MNSQDLPFSVDQTILDKIILHRFEIPAKSKATDYLPGLMTNLGSADSDLREFSLDVLWNWISQQLYTDGELLNIAQQMVANMTAGLGENGSDSVFLRAFSTLILAATLETDLDRRDKG